MAHFEVLIRTISSGPSQLKFLMCKLSKFLPLGLRVGANYKMYLPLRRLDTRKSFFDNSYPFSFLNFLSNLSNTRQKLKMADECLAEPERARDSKNEQITWYANKAIFAWQKFAGMWLVAEGDVLRYWRLLRQLLCGRRRNRQNYGLLYIHIFWTLLSILRMSSLCSNNNFRMQNRSRTNKIDLAPLFLVRMWKQ